MGRPFLTAAERRLAALLFGLSLLGLLARGGARVSSEVRAWLAESTAVPVTPVPAAPPDTQETAEVGQTASASAERVNINTASPDLLTTLPGVGPVLAARIVEDRAQHGPYRRVEELARVRGVGPATVARLRARIALE